MFHANFRLANSYFEISFKAADVLFHWRFFETADWSLSGIAFYNMLQQATEGQGGGAGADLARSRSSILRWDLGV